jgi:hypothetical protein
MSRRGKGVVRLVSFVYAVLDSLHRVFVSLFGHPQPIEWWLLAADVAIVGLIVWLDVPEKLHKRRCAKIVAVLSDFMVRGHTLAASVPNPHVQEGGSSDNIETWRQSVETWRTETAQYLNTHSSKAASAFLLITVSETNVTNIVYPLEGWSFHLSGYQREAYQALLGYMDNLRAIIEKPEVYF